MLRGAFLFFSLSIAVCTAGACTGEDPNTGVSIDGPDSGQESDAPSSQEGGGGGCSPACSPEQVCCSGACVPADAENCYACGTKCAGDTPVCHATPKKCGCSVGVCAPAAKGCEPSTGECQACDTLGANASDFYVDRDSFEGSPGTQRCPVRTIKKALELASASTAPNKTIHVAAGTYDAALGETFPIVLRDITIAGAGALRTIIKGTFADHQPGAGQFVGLSPKPGITLLVGHPTAMTVVSDLTILPGDGASISSAALCTDGNVPNVGDPPPLPPAPNTVFKNVTIGPGFDGYAGILVSNGYASGQPVGCNFSFEGGRILDATRGIFAVGKGFYANPGVGEGWTALSVSDATITGSSFPKGGAPITGGPGIEVGDQVRITRVTKTTFENNVDGILLIQPTKHAPNHFNFNTFKGNAHSGIWLANTGQINELHDNVFEGNRTKAASVSAETDVGVGLLLARPTAAGSAPNVGSARRNRFVGNGIGVLFAGQSDLVSVSNFGDGTSAGENTFSCNSTTSGFAFEGGDVFVRFTGTGANATHPFQGNTWDRAPPAGAGNGVDLVKDAVTTIDTVGAKASVTACPTGFVK
jgi:hypothetical protein